MHGTCVKHLFLLVHVGSLESREGSTEKSKRWSSLAGAQSSFNLKGNNLILLLGCTMYFCSSLPGWGRVLIFFFGGGGGGSALWSKRLMCVTFLTEKATLSYAFDSIWHIYHIPTAGILHLFS